MRHDDHLSLSPCLNEKRDQFIKKPIFGSRFSSGWSMTRGLSSASSKRKIEKQQNQFPRVPGDNLRMSTPVVFDLRTVP